MQHNEEEEEEKEEPIEKADRAGPECPNHIFPRAICQHRNIPNDTEKYSRHNTKISLNLQRYSKWYKEILIKDKEKYCLQNAEIFSATFSWEHSRERDEE